MAEIETGLGNPDYPRDLIGYGRTPPDPRWPGGARVAVQVVVNYEEGGENCILHGDAASEAFLSEIIGAQPWPGQRHLNMESIYEYGARAGFWRLWRMLTGRGVPVTVYGVATALARNPEAVAGMREAGWEIASHGLKWIEYKDFPPRRRKGAHGRGDPPPQGGDRRAALGLVHRALLGEHAGAGDGGGWIPLLLGFICRRPALLGEGAEGAVPDRALHAGCQRHALRHGAGLQLGRAVPRLSEGQPRRAPRRGPGGESPKMLSIGLHCRLAGRPGRAAALARFLDYALAQPGVWFARRIDIARHWHEHHAPKE